MNIVQSKFEAAYYADIKKNTLHEKDFIILQGAHQFLFYFVPSNDGFYMLLCVEHFKKSVDQNFPNSNLLYDLFVSLALRNLRIC